MEIARDGSGSRLIADNIPMANAFDVGPDGKLYFPAQPPTKSGASAWMAARLRW